MRTESAGMHDALWDSFVIEVLDLFEENAILKQSWAALAPAKRIFIVRDNNASLSGKWRMRFIRELMKLTAITG
jgi:hypothetical protein